MRGASVSDPSEWYDEMKSSNAAINAHPGSVATNRWTSLRRSYTVFVRNASDLRLFLADVEQNPATGARFFPVSGANRAVEADEFIHSLDQKLHNLLSAAISLVDHTRASLAVYEQHDFFAEWTTRSNAVRDAPVSKFIRDFRNAALHAAHSPPYTQNLSIAFGSSGSYELRISLPSAPLLAMSSSAWSSPAKRYIRESGKGVHLRTATDEYIELMESLYRRAFDQFDRLHSDEVAEVNAMVSAHNAKWNAGPPPDVNDGS